MSRHAVVDLLGYQAAFWLLIASAGSPFELLVCASLVAALCLLWYWAPSMRPNWLLLVFACALGPWVDFTLASSGLVEYASYNGSSLPLWILCLWLIFGQSLSWSFAPLLQARLRWALPALACGAPLAYLGGTRMGSASLAEPMLASLAAISLSWMGVFLLLRQIALHSQQGKLVLTR